MLGDARSLWFSAAGALQNVKENISTALDKIDLEQIINDEEDAVVRSSKGITMEEIEAELESYKGMLDDAQVQLYELSKHSRVMIGQLYLCDFVSMQEHSSFLTILQPKKMPSSPSTKRKLKAMAVAVAAAVNQKV